MSNQAARNEATGNDKPIIITWDGQHVRLVPSDDWDIEVLEALEDGKITHILRGIIADDGYDRLVKLHPKIKDLEGFLNKAMRALGVQGN
jgi:hypothetical protein